MVNNMSALLPSLNKLTTEKDKDKVTGAVTLPAKVQDAQTTPSSKEKEDLLAEDKELLDMLKKMEEESKNPPFVISVDKGKKKELDDFYLASKKNNLKMLVKAAQLRSPQQYTSKSWAYLRRVMREAMRISGNGNVSSTALNKALNLMRSGLSGLRYNVPAKPEYKNLKKPLPMEKIAQKPKTVKDIFGEEEKKYLVYGEQKVENGSTESTSTQGQAETGGNVDVSCSETAVAAEGVDVQA